MIKLNDKEIIDRLGKLSHMGESLLNETIKGDSFGTLYCKDISGCNSWKVQSQSFLCSIVGNDSIHHKYFADTINGSKASTVKAGIGILEATIEGVKGGYLTRYETLVSAEIFRDFLEIAEHLLENNYYHPAASLIGATLEDGLRKICAH